MRDSRTHSPGARSTVAGTTLAAREHPFLLVFEYRHAVAQIVNAKASVHLESGLGEARLDVNTTPQMTCFRGARVCPKWLQGKVMMN